MTNVDTLTIAEFLLARIAEDVEDLEPSRIGDGPEWWMPDAWTRERGLAECEAKRKIVELHQQCGSGTGYCDDGGHGYDPGEGCGTLAGVVAVPPVVAVAGPAAALLVQFDDLPLRLTLSQPALACPGVRHPPFGAIADA